MKTDLDTLMQAHQIDALLITGPAQHNPPMYYLTGGGHISNAELIIRQGQVPLLLYNPMERDEAAKTGLATKSLEEYSLTELIRQNNGDMVKAKVMQYQKILSDLGLISGRMAIYGARDAGEVYATFTKLREAMPSLEIIGEMENSLLLQAMATKEPGEVERIRRMGKITTEVVGMTADFLTSHKTKKEVLIKPDGQPLTIREVKSRINLWLAERGAESPHGTIFAIGRDAGVPHSSGNPTDYLRLGQTIVFDIYPCEAGGGYYHDFTRTWCLGYATDEAQAIYDDVLAVYQQIMNELKVGEHCPIYQRRACELFEQRGHPTVCQNPKTQEGYVHALGHGVGLYVHERPWFGRNAGSEDKLFPGSVVTIEPGLYYPERELGVRLEDTVWVQADGKLEILAEYPFDFILPMRK